MAIVGVAEVLYGVEDVDKSTKFYEDFGLSLTRRNATESRFDLEDGSAVILRKIDDDSIPASNYQGFGIKETVWGVDTKNAFDKLVTDLSKDREVKITDDGTAHFLSDCGMALGLRVFNRRKVLYAPDPINSPNNVNRLNQNRKWRKSARPKTLNHVVFGVLDYHQSTGFFRERLGFRLSDHQKGVGNYLRCDGAADHHNLFLINCQMPGIGGNPCFHHINFGVEDIDELMVGANRLMKCGYTPGFLGNGRHRISSALFSYWRSPAGGEAEYGTDSDYLDDNWVPREWEFRFGTAIWMQTPPSFMQDEIEWDVGFYKEFSPEK